MTAVDPGRPTSPVTPVTSVTPVVPDLAETLSRIEAVRVNLLPPEIRAARQGHRVRRVAVAALVVLVLALGAASFVARSATGAARTDLAAADAVTAGLRAQQGRYAPVVTLQEQVRTATARLARVTAGDLDWGPLLTAVRAATPVGAGLTGIDAGEDPGPAGSAGGAPGGTGDTTGTTGNAASPAAAAPSAPAATAPAAGAASPTPTPAGTIVLTGEATGPSVVATFVDALAAVVGLDAVVVTGISPLAEGGYSFGVLAVVTTAAARPVPATGAGR